MLICGPVAQQHFPYVQGWNFTFSHQFRDNCMAEGDYSGSRGTNLVEKPGEYRHSQCLPRRSWRPWRSWPSSNEWGIGTGGLHAFRGCRTFVAVLAARRVLAKLT